MDTDTRWRLCRPPSHHSHTQPPESKILNWPFGAQYITFYTVPRWQTLVVEPVEGYGGTYTVIAATYGMTTLALLVHQLAFYSLQNISVRAMPAVHYVLPLPLCCLVLHQCVVLLHCPSWLLRVGHGPDRARLRLRHRLCLVFPFPSRLRQCLWLVCSTSFAAKTLPLLCV